MPIKVLIVDDHPVVRSGIRMELEKQSDIQVVGEATNGDEAFTLACELLPDVLLLDINMPGMNAIKLVRELKTSENAPRILILTAHNDLEYILGMLKAGAEGYLLKEENPAYIIEGLRAIQEDKIWLSESVRDSIVRYSIEPESKHDSLSAREMEVLILMAKGHSNPEIAEQLVIAEGTVKNHVSAIYSKLGVHSRAQAVAWAWQQEVVK